MGDDGRLKIRVQSNDGSKLLVDGISTGQELVIAGLFSTEDVETWLLQGKIIMAQFKPFATINVRPFIRIGKVSGSQFGNSKTLTYNSYRELKRDMENLVNQSEDGEVRVTRSRRGQWGEWIEVWSGGKITYQTWM